MASIALSIAACSGGGATGESEDDLTSLAARSRELAFEGIVYVPTDMQDKAIIDVAHDQAQTAFGALRTANVAVNSRELDNIDPKTFVKREVTMIDPKHPEAPGPKLLEVRYTYNDHAVVDKSMAFRSSLPSALMGPKYAEQTPRVLRECTTNDKEAREFQDTLWYLFEPGRPSCRDAIKKETGEIEADRAKLKDPKTQVTPSEVNRLYLPITVRLGNDKTNRGLSFPDYHRLFAGGIEKDKVIVSLVVGLIDEDTTIPLHKDSGYSEWLATLEEVFKGQPGFEVVDVKTVDGGSANKDVANYTLKTGKQVNGLTFEDFIAWELRGTREPKGLTNAEFAELKQQVGERVGQKWVTFRRTVKVTIQNLPEHDVDLELITFFGSNEDTTPFKFAFKHSDVFVYNGHSFIGFGPLDPKNFTKRDLPDSYQIFFIDSCVSYNYYERDYIPLKNRGTLDLDLITNGVEAPVSDSGPAQGRFIATILDARASYKDLLETVKATDSLRVVDGELDNTYSPSTTPVKIRTP
jgi:hypothetical protein